MKAQSLLRPVSVGLLVASLFVAGPAPALAQSLTLWGGVYSPLGSDVNLGAIGGSVQRNNSFAGGIRLTGWGSSILGVEAVGGYSPASVNVAGIRIDAEDYIYNGDIGGDKATRNDLILSTGLSLGL
jgi:hypothetical protein